MGTLEQLKKLHSEALTRLSEHPDFKLIHTLGPIIEEMEAGSQEAAVEEAAPMEAQEDPQTDVVEDISAEEASENTVEDDTADVATFAAGAAAVATAGLAITAETDEAVAELDAQADEAITDAVDTIEFSGEDISSDDVIEETETAAQDVETDISETFEAADLEADIAASIDETAFEIPESELTGGFSESTDSVPQVEAAAEDVTPVVETSEEAIAETAEKESSVDEAVEEAINADDFPTEEAHIGSIDESIDEALADIDLGEDIDLEVDASAQAPEIADVAPAVSTEPAETTLDEVTEDTEVPAVEAGHKFPDSEQSAPSVSAGEHLDSETADAVADQDETPSIEALIDEQVAKLLSQDQPLR